MLETYTCYILIHSWRCFQPLTAANFVSICLIIDTLLISKRNSHFKQLQSGNTRASKCQKRKKKGSISTESTEARTGVPKVHVLVVAVCGACNSRAPPQTDSVSSYWLDTLKALNFFQVNCIFFSELFLLAVLELCGASGCWHSLILGAFLSRSSTTFLTLGSFSCSPSRCSLSPFLDPGIADFLSSTKDGYTSLQKPIISVESQRLSHIRHKYIL